MRNRSIVLSILVLACACGPAIQNGQGDDGGSGGGSGGGGGGGGGGESFADAAVCSKMDVLFVIDNSGSMQEEQTNLIANFPQFITVLDQSGLDYRVAVTTTSRNYAWTVMIGGGTTTLTSTGESGQLHKTPTMTKPWLEKSDPNVAQTFSTLANVGINGSGMEMPLGAMRDAFEARMTDGTNMGFRRPDALLGIVILTDENDCSYEGSSTMLSDLGGICAQGMGPVANYKMFLDQYTGNATRWATAIIAGPGPGDCTSSFGTANEATRLIELKNQVGPNAIMSSICDGDLSVGLKQATMLFQSACDNIIL
jgi:hypothetical protein